MKLNKWISIIVVIVALLVTAKVALGAVPTAENGAVTTLEDTTYVFAVADFDFSDEDGDSLAAVRITGLPSKGTLKVSATNAVEDQIVTAANLTAGQLTFVPVAQENGAPYTTLTFTVIDNGAEGDNESAEATMTINVTSVDDKPVVNTITDQSKFEDIAFEIVVSVTDVDNTGETFAIDENASTVKKGDAAAVSFATADWIGVDATNKLKIKGTQTETGDYQVTVVVKEEGTTVESSLPKQFTLTIKPIFAIQNLEVNGKSSGELTIEEANEVTFDVENAFTEDLENVAVTVRIKDVGDDDLEEEADEFDLKDGKEEEITAEFRLDSEDIDEDSYELEIEVTGETEDGDEYTTIFTKTVDIDRPRHRVIVSKALANPETVSCNFEQTSLQVTIENIGKSDEDNVEIRVSNAALKIDERKESPELEKYSERDNDYRATFDLSLKGAVAGDYELNVEVYLDGEVDDSEKVEITVQGCAVPDAPVEREESLPVTDEFVQQLRAQLEESLAQQQEVRPIRTVEGFRQSDVYVALLAVLTVLLLVAVLLGLVTMVTKRR